VPYPLACEFAPAFLLVQLFSVCTCCVRAVYVLCTCCVRVFGWTGAIPGVPHRWCGVVSGRALLGLHVRVLPLPQGPQHARTVHGAGKEVRHASCYLSPLSLLPLPSLLQYPALSLPPNLSPSVALPPFPHALPLSFVSTTLVLFACSLNDGSASKGVPAPVSLTQAAGRELFPCHLLSVTHALPAFC
jgi:hypothetical protein